MNDLARLGKLLGLDVVGVLRERHREWGRVWAVRLDDGRTVVLGSDRHVRDRHYLLPTLAAAGGASRMPHVSAREVCELLRVIDREGANA